MVYQSEPLLIREKLECFLPSRGQRGPTGHSQRRPGLHHVKEICPEACLDSRKQCVAVSIRQAKIAGHLFSNAAPDGRIVAEESLIAGLYESEQRPERKADLDGACHLLPLFLVVHFACVMCACDQNFFQK